MLELRKVLVFIFVTILLFYMLRLLYFTKKKWQFKTYTFIILIGGISLINIATFLDVIAGLVHKPIIYTLIRTFFTLGAIIYIIGVILWSNFTKDMMSKLEKLALTDPLTGVLNRNGIEKIYESLTTAQDPFYVIVCDLDGTKRINDTYGHIEGDKFIYKTSKIITNVIGSKGYLARIGGDEFIILLKYIEIQEVESIISSIKNEISKIYPEKNTGISLGYALFPTDGITFKELMKSADKKMYDDKKNLK